MRDEVTRGQLTSVTSLIHVNPVSLRLLFLWSYSRIVIRLLLGLLNFKVSPLAFAPDLNVEFPITPRGKSRGR